MSRLVIVPYREQWPAEFAQTRDALSAALGPVAERIAHIGSTAVPGLAAKDIIDVQVGVRDLDDPRLASAFEKLGATATEIHGDHVPTGHTDPAGWKKRLYRPPASWRPTNLHVRQVGLANFRYALLFRDYLRHSLPVAAAYAQVKIALARLHPDDPEAYYDVKDPVCDLIMHAAERWATETRWSA
jgi:GrpB-like predicted nucleotidyltransferase (UPF0157 family)